MRILGIESSSLVASVAIVTDGVVTGEYTMNYKKTHSQTLLPMLDELTRMLDLELDTIDAVAVSGDGKRPGAGFKKAVDSCAHLRCDGV